MEVEPTDYIMEAMIKRAVRKTISPLVCDIVIGQAERQGISSSREFYNFLKRYFGSDTSRLLREKATQEYQEEVRRLQKHDPGFGIQYRNR